MLWLPKPSKSWCFTVSRGRTYPLGMEYGFVSFRQVHLIEVGSGEAMWVCLGLAGYSHASLPAAKKKSKKLDVCGSNLYDLVNMIRRAVML